MAVDERQQSLTADRVLAVDAQGLQLVQRFLVAVLGQSGFPQRLFVGDQGRAVGAARLRRQPAGADVPPLGFEPGVPQRAHDRGHVGRRPAGMPVGPDGDHLPAFGFFLEVPFRSEACQIKVALRLFVRRFFSGAPKRLEFRVGRVLV